MQRNEKSKQSVVPSLRKDQCSGAQRSPVLILSKRHHITAVACTWFSSLLSSLQQWRVALLIPIWVLQIVQELHLFRWQKHFRTPWCAMYVMQTLVTQSLLLLKRVAHICLLTFVSNSNARIVQPFSVFLCFSLFAFKFSHLPSVYPFILPS
jgi:hypothetical protein